MSKEFNTLILYIEKMKSRYFHALSAFHIYETMNELLAPNIIGEGIAEENLVIIKRYSNFFLPSKEALRVYFFLELAKLLDTSDQSLHLGKILKYTEANISKLNVNDFIEYDKERELIQHLIESYKGMSFEDLNEIRVEINKHKDIINKVKTYRDKYLAHDDINKCEISITGEEIMILFSLLKKILNLFSSKLNSSTTIYQTAEEDTKIDTKQLVEHLKKFWPYFLKEIEDERDELIKKYEK